MLLKQSLKHFLIGAVILCGISSVQLATAYASETTEATTAIKHILMDMFDQPEQRLTVDPVIIEGDIAVTGWAQGETGGRALMRRHKGNWHIVLCGGDALREAKALQQFGLTAEQAEKMSKSIAEAEAKLDPAQVQKFSLFDGVMMMNEDGSHPPVEGHH